jgi:RNA-directed DNA polymerase
LSHSFTLDWVITCKSAAEARSAVAAARRILKQLGVELHPQKTRIVHIRQGFEFLGYQIRRGKNKLRLPSSKIRRAAPGGLYAYPKEKSIRRFMDAVRHRTRRKASSKTDELIANLNPLLRGWGEYYKRAHVRRLFHRLDHCGGSGRIDSSIGVTLGGRCYLPERSMASTSL